MNNMNELCEKYYWLIDEAKNDPNETRVTVKGILAKFAGEVVTPEVKPRTKVDYVKCTESNTCVWDLKEMLGNGELFSKSSAGEYTMYSNSAPTYMLSHFVEHGVYRKVETEMTWQDEVKSSTDAIALNCTVAHMIDFAPEKLIEISHLVASMADKPKG